MQKGKLWNLQLPLIVWQNITKFTVSLPFMIVCPDWNTLESCAMAFMFGIEDNSAVMLISKLKFMIEKYQYLSHDKSISSPLDIVARLATLQKRARQESTKIQEFDWSQILEILRPHSNSHGQLSYNEG